jgi:hypothetical protein
VPASLHLRTVTEESSWQTTRNCKAHYRPNMPVNLFPAPYSRIQQAPVIISPTPASHALPQLGGSLGMVGTAHPHPAMSTALMPDAPAAAIGLSMHMPSQSVRVPGAVLTNGVASKSHRAHAGLH